MKVDPSVNRGVEERDFGSARIPEYPIDPIRLENCDRFSGSRPHVRIPSCSVDL